MERLHVLGTGNAAVTRCYNTCFALEKNGEFLLCDAGGGNGILRQLKLAGIGFGSIHHLIITHAHCDHLLGVVWVLRMVCTAMKGGSYKGHLHIYCHRSIVEGLSAMVRLMLPEALCAFLGDRILFHGVEDGMKVEILGHKVTFFDIGSTKLLQYGFTLILPDGQKLCCLGDEPYNPACARWVEGSKWLLSEAFCLYEHREIFKPYEKHHSTVKDAAKLAQALGVSHLVLWHTEDRYLDERKQNYTREARSEYKGNVYVPDDLEVISLV